MKMTATNRRPAVVVLGVAVFVALAVAASACTAGSRSTRGAGLQRQIAQLKVQLARTTADMTKEHRLFNDFRDQVSYQARLDMLSYVFEATIIGGGGGLRCA